MTKQITSYKELLEERERLEALLKSQKELVKQDMRAIKEEFAPVRAAVAFTGKLLSRDRSNWVLNASANAAIDLLVKKLLLGRAGWITKWLVPFVLKNYSSHFISENKDSIVQKIFSWFHRRSSANGQEHFEEEEARES